MTSEEKSGFFGFCMLVVVVSAAIVGGYCIGTSRPPATLPPTSRLKTFDVVLSDGTSFGVKGTEIRPNGACVEILVDGTPDTIICPSYIITEVMPVVAAPARLREAPTSFNPKGTEVQHKTTCYDVLTNGVAEPACFDYTVTVGPIEEVEE